MAVNATLLGQLIIVWILIATTITFLLARRKTQTPIIATLLGFLFSFIPPVSMLYLIVLVIKNDIVDADQPDSQITD